MKDLKLVYQAVNKDAAEKALDDLELKWGEDYPIVIKSWRDNWDRLSAYFQYSEHIRRIIYTTNTMEGYHRQLRRVTKKQGRIHIRHGSGKACISGLYTYTQEMYSTCPELGTNCPATSNSLPGEVQIDRVKVLIFEFFDFIDKLAERF